MVDASKAEALLAVDLYNRPIHERSFEAFVVHMHIAWTYLLHAEFERSGIDYRHWNPRGTRLIRIDGEPKTWDLQECVKNRWPADDPVRTNLGFFTGLRNKIEHRFDDAIALVTSGHAQANLLNFEHELVTQFGADETIADLLRFPVFLRSLTTYGEAALREVQKRLPARAHSYMTDFHSGLDEDVRDDQRFQFRLHLIPWVGPKTEADLAIRFISLDDLTDEERVLLAGLERTGRVIIRERQRPIQHLGGLSPTAVVREVRAEIPFEFTMWNFVQAWKHFGVRPEGGSTEPEKTDERYCIYDAVHGDYIYKPAYVQKLIRYVGIDHGYHEVFQRDPITKQVLDVE